MLAMEGAQCWSVEAKAFEVLIKGGASGVRIFEKGKKKTTSIFVRREELAWLVGALEEVADSDKAVTFWDQSRAGFPRIISQKRSNRHGRFLMIEEFEGRRRCGSILVPEGRFGQGWARLMVELDDANSRIWEGNVSREKPSVLDVAKCHGLEVKSSAANHREVKSDHRVLEKACARGFAPANQKNRAVTLACDPCATASTSASGSGVFGDALCGGEVTVGLLGGAPIVPGDALCGGDATAGRLGGTISKGQWVQALLTPAPQSEQEACLPRQGPSREKIDRDLGEHAFNATVELLNCREWLRRIRGEVDVGLQRLDRVLKDLDVYGPGQVRLGFRKPGPNGKKPPIPKASSAGSGLGSKVGNPLSQPRRLLVSSQNGLGLGPKGGNHLGQNKSHMVSNKNGPGAVLDVQMGSNGHPSGPTGAGCTLACADHGLLPEAGPTGSHVAEPSTVMGAVGTVVGRMDSGVARSVGSPTGLAVGRPDWGADSSMGSGDSSPARVGAPAIALSPGFVSRSASSRERGFSRSAKVSPAQVGKASTQTSPVMGGKDLCLRTPGSLWLAKRPVTEPSKLQVYQRSRWRFSRPLLSTGPSCSPGQLVDRGTPGPISSVSPVRLDFDGVEVDPLEPAITSPSVRSLESASYSDEVVPESGPGSASAGSCVPGVNSVGAEKLDNALVISKAVGMTCDGQPGLLKEFLGSIVAKNLSRGFGGERDSQVLNEF
jgi:hypothetical protein